MSDSYQPIYDAVRSRISGGNVGEAVAEVARQAFDISYAVSDLRQYAHVVLDAAVAAAHQHARPSAVYRPMLGKDGDMWCFLYGSNLQEGVAGFGATPESAAVAFDLAWLNETIPAPRSVAAAIEGDGRE